MKLIYIDVMEGDAFLFQMSYLWAPIFKLNMSEVESYVYEQKPFLRNRKNIKIYPNANKLSKPIKSWRRKTDR